MNPGNVKLILAREVRDQLRDRRTLFMIAVLPILLYPLLGMSFLQIAQFMQERPTTVLVVGAPELDDLPPLFGNERFDPALFAAAEGSELLHLSFEPAGGDGDGGQAAAKARARRAVRTREYDAALVFPADFAERLGRFREEVRRRAPPPAEGEAIAGAAEETGAAADSPAVPSPEIVYSTASERSGLTAHRLGEVLRRWTEKVGEANLSAGGFPAAAARPFVVQQADVAEEAGRQGLVVWAKILPILLLLWALTGAFYPAVDLCAGEKERGTLETLLSSPAERSEIVVGKLLTIMLFSMATAALNLLSMGVTGWMVFPHLPNLGPPPLLAVAWLSLSLLPVAALFSALCLALAAFARSSKEGQYYLMPLLLVTMPLVILPMTPSVELNAGNAIIPVTGVVLLLRSLLEADYVTAFTHAPLVIAVTLGGCVLAVRWAVDQFNQESVLFRESERLDVGLWLRHLVRDRGPTPTVAAAAACGVAILVVRFFMSFALPPPENAAQTVNLVLVTQFVVILTPALLFTVMLTSDRLETLLLKPPRSVEGTAAVLLGTGAAALLAIALHPSVNLLQWVVLWLYPLSEEAAASLQSLLVGDVPLWQLFVAIALVTPICEELAFRGFILSGFRHMGYKWRAIILSAIFFGAAHAILQQSLIAALVGVVIGYLAVQTGNLLPCIAFHVVHNGLAILSTRLSSEAVAEWPLLEALYVPLAYGEGHVFRLPVVVVSMLLSAAILYGFSRLRWHMTEEERLQRAIARGLAAP